MNSGGNNNSANEQDKDQNLQRCIIKYKLSSIANEIDDLHSKFRQLPSDIVGLGNVSSAKLPQVYQRVEFKVYTDVLKSIRESIELEVKQACEAFVSRRNNLSVITKEKITMLSLEGWYCDLGKIESDFIKFLFNIISADDDESRANIADYYRNNLKRIETSLIESYPAREKFLKRAFQAHHEADYITSIPLLMMFTDGITFEKIDKTLYGSRNKQLKIKNAFIDQLEVNEFQKATLTAISEYSAINGREDEMNDSEINRHYILHGKSLDYDTEINSLKVISFANYVAGVFKSWPTISD